ncbi:type VI secretion system baseplate subunit TssF [Kangiella sp.]|uniref:type VI secretion system baseplate subunit TssF n=1 Tax=Kangiella sp. TaxID=1920245 RepID=UPI0019C2D082|nr:type VI secretion system baseplate subunit TssF [Kangiella sp.]MBD3654743.1 type VI secretion system baseplate subunit TssF [Kangiella sp.]
MSDRLLSYFERELESIKQEAVEFARANPGLAPNLGINEKGIDDPNVNRLIESVAFLNAKISKKLDDGVDELAESIMGTLYPDVEAPFPATSAIKCVLDGSLTTTTRIEKGELISVVDDKGEEWTFATAASTELAPIDIVNATYSRLPFEKPEHKASSHIKAKLTIELAVQKVVAKDEVIAINQIGLKLNDEPRINSLLYQAMARDLVCLELVYGDCSKVLDSGVMKKAGFDIDLNLLPKSYQQLDSMQLAREVLNSQQSFEHLLLDQLELELKATERLVINLYLLTDNPELEQAITHKSFAYGCLPVLNLFQQAAEPYKLKGNETREIEVRGSKGEILEVYKVDRVDYLQGKSERQTLAAAYQPGIELEGSLRWSAKRIHKSAQQGSYSKTVLSILGNEEQDEHIICPMVWVKNHKDISRVINRAQKLVIQFHEARSELKSVELVETVRAGKSVEHNGQARWSLLKKTGIGYITTNGVAALQEILQQANIYKDNQINLMIEAITDCKTERIVKRAFDKKHSGFISGQKVTVQISTEPFGNFSLYLFGLVISRLLTELTAINSFTELEIVTNGQHQQKLRYPARMGQIQFI